MKYLNQFEYKDTPYPTNISNPESPLVNGTISRAGCGLCTACMMVEQLTFSDFPLLECRDLAIEVKANLTPGTNMKIFGPVVAEKFNLSLEKSDDIQDLIKCLQSGGGAIINVGGDHDDHIGVFSHGGHYIYAVSTDGEQICILDPSKKDGKYEEEGRQGKVRVNGDFAYCSKEVLHADVQNRTPAYYLFTRKSDLGE
ncbi:MAG: hypothetical protein R3Y09_06120 [Clostridia bacterium]